MHHRRSLWTLGQHLQLFRAAKNGARKMVVAKITSMRSRGTITARQRSGRRLNVQILAGAVVVSPVSVLYSSNLKKDPHILGSSFATWSQYKKSTNLNSSMAVLLRRPASFISKRRMEFSG
jgi:hypothetical protein